MRCRLRMARLSEVHNKSLRKFNRNQAVRDVTDEALRGFMAITVLRNGPRILRACNTMAVQRVRNGW